MDETGDRLAPVEEVEERAGEHPVDDPNKDCYEPSPTHENAHGATELAQLRRDYSRASTRASTKLADKPSTLPGKLFHEVKKFWRRQISVTVDHHTCRDHLALERTFLGYLRTSLALSMMGITVAQLFRLQHSPHPDGRIGFYVLGKPLACICQGAAIYTLFIGAFRTWRTQNAIIRGKAISGGFEIVALAGGLFILLLLFSVILVTVNVLKEDVDTTGGWVLNYTNDVRFELTRRG